MKDPVASNREFLRLYEYRWVQAGRSVALNAYMNNRTEKAVSLNKVDDSDIRRKELLDFMLHAGKRSFLKTGITPEQATNSIYIFGRGLLFTWALGFEETNLLQEAEPYWDFLLPAFFR